MAKKEHRYNAWRPTVMTEEIVNKLLTAFAYSFSDAEACLYAWISKQTLYDYCKRHPDFSDQKEELKNKPNIKAKMNWIEKINNKDYQASKEWLERKAKDEFSLKTETDNTHKITDYTFTSNLEDDDNSTG